MERKRFEGLILQAVRSLPPEFRKKMENVEIVVEDWFIDPLEPGEQTTLRLHRTIHEGALQDSTDVTQIGATFDDWDSGPACRWIRFDPAASGFPFLMLENPCR